MDAQVFVGHVRNVDFILIALGGCGRVSLGQRHDLICF